MRTIIIGDIHGCNDALQALLERIKPDIWNDQLVLLGDLFDRGPDSFLVFQTIRKLADAFGQRFVLLRGNHEDYLLQSKLTIQQRFTWEKVGRGATVRSFQKVGRRMEDAAPWLQEHCSLFWKSERFQCVHAGVIVEPMEANDLQTMIHDHRTVFENRYAGMLTVTGHVALKRAAWFTGDGETVVDLEDGKIYDLPQTGVICIDTGCGKGGRLTAMVVNDSKYTLISEEEK